MRGFFTSLDKEIVFSCNISCFLIFNSSLYNFLMSVLNQKTINDTIEFQGIGLHSGSNVSLMIKPSAAEYGIWFRRTDVKNLDNMIAAHYLNVSESTLCTKLSNDSGVSISTVEHLMAALSGCGIQNALIEVDGPEIPIMDGSSEWFVRKILTGGINSSLNELELFM